MSARLRNVLRQLRLRLKHRIRDPRVGDVIRLNGDLYVVLTIEWPSHDVGLEQLGEFLAQHIWVSGEDAPLAVSDALLAAGWIPPGRERLVARA